MTTYALAAGLLLALAVAACGQDSPATPTPTPEFARILRSGDPASGAVAIVIETGTSAGNIEELLAVLRDERARVSFSVTGLWAERNPDSLNAIARAGHQLINGTYDGASWTGASTGASPLDATERALSLSRTETTVYRQALRSARPYAALPQGDLDPAAAAEAAAEGITVLVLPARGDTLIAAGVIIAFDATSSDATALRALLARIRTPALVPGTIASVDRPNT